MIKPHEGLAWPNGIIDALWSFLIPAKTSRDMPLTFKWPSKHYQSGCRVCRGEKSRVYHYYKKCFLRAPSCLAAHSGPENLKKSRQKNLWNQINPIFFREIAFLAVLNFFPLKKIILGHFWNCKKWNLVKKIFDEIDLFDFTSFLA